MKKMSMILLAIGIMACTKKETNLVDTGNCNSNVTYRLLVTTADTINCNVVINYGDLFDYPATLDYIGYTHTVTVTPVTVISIVKISMDPLHTITTSTIVTGNPNPITTLDYSFTLMQKEGLLIHLSNNPVLYYHQMNIKLFKNGLLQYFTITNPAAFDFRIKKDENTCVNTTLKIY